MMNTQSEALRLAEQLRDMSTMFKAPSHNKGVCNGASFELRRLHHNEEVLRNALWKACGDIEQVVKETIESQGELK